MTDDAGTTHCGSPFRVIFTDLDGTLLDAETYSWEKAGEALGLCRESRVPVVLASSKTRAEMVILRDRMSLADPFISENGGGLFLARASAEAPLPGAEPDRDLWKVVLGTPYKELVRALKEIEKELGYEITGFADMDPDEIMSLTGLEREMALLAAQREFDEPFVIRSPAHPEITALERGAQKRALAISRGGRFFHLHGKNNKGRAMEKIIAFYKQTYGDVVSIALATAPMIFPCSNVPMYRCWFGPSKLFPGF